jgi:hypothetical protein
LAINLGALAHFVAESFRFLQTSERELIRERYTSNWVVPQELNDRLRRTVYMATGQNIFVNLGSPTPMILFGRGGLLGGTLEEAEIDGEFAEPVLLYDVWMRPLHWTLRHWWSRCRQKMQPLGGAGESAGLHTTDALVAFLPAFDRTIQGRTAWCRRRGGLPFTAFERRVIRSSFRFRKVRP